MSMKDILSKIALLESKQPKQPVEESWTDFEDAKKAHEQFGGKVTGRPDDYTVTTVDGERRRYITKDGKRRIERLPPVAASRDDDEDNVDTKKAKKEAKPRKEAKPEEGAKRRGRPTGSKNKKKISEMTDAEWHLVMRRVAVMERTLSEPEKKKKEEIAKSMKDSPEKIADLKKRYGKRWKEVVYATATKKAKDLKEDQGVAEDKGSKPDFLDVDKDGDRKESFKKAVKDKETIKEGGMAFQEGDYVYFGSQEGTIERFDGDVAIIQKRNGDLTAAKIGELSSEKPGMMKKAASWMIGDSLQEEAVDEEDVGEGNEFSGELAKAKAAGQKEFEVDGKTYPVKEDQLEECGGDMSYGPGMPEQKDKVNVNANMSSDGTKTLNVTAEGDAAAELAQLLKLSGMLGDSADREHPGAIPVVGTMDAEGAEDLSKMLRHSGIKDREGVEEEYANEPDEEVAGIAAVTQTGDDLHSKGKEFLKVNGGGNPMVESLEKKLWAEFQKVKQK